MFKLRLSDCSAHSLVVHSPRPFRYMMAQTGVASARAAGHAARLAVHAASGLAWSAGLTDAARCLRAAEGAVRAALAQLHSEPLRHQGAGETAGEAAQQQDKAPQKKRRRRKKRVRPSGPQQPVVGKEAAADHMEVEPPTPPPQLQVFQLEEQSAEESAKAEEAEPEDLTLGMGEKEVYLARHKAVVAAQAFVASRLRESSLPKQQLTALSELVERQDQELVDKSFGNEADEKALRVNHAALLKLHTQLLAEERRRQHAATDDVPFSLVRAGKTAVSRAGKGRTKQ